MQKKSEMESKTFRLENISHGSSFLLLLLCLFSSLEPVSFLFQHANWCIFHFCTTLLLTTYRSDAQEKYSTLCTQLMSFQKEIAEMLENSVVFPRDFGVEYAPRKLLIHLLVSFAKNRGVFFNSHCTLFSSSSHAVPMLLKTRMEPEFLAEEEKLQASFAREHDGEIPPPEAVQAMINQHNMSCAEVSSSLQRQVLSIRKRSAHAQIHANAPSALNYEALNSRTTGKGLLIPPSGASSSSSSKWSESINAWPWNGIATVNRFICWLSMNSILLTYKYLIDWINWLKWSARVSLLLRNGVSLESDWSLSPSHNG